MKGTPLRKPSKLTQPHKHSAGCTRCPVIKRWLWPTVHIMVFFPAYWKTSYHSQSLPEEEHAEQDQMTSNPGAERQGQVNSGNKFSGLSLWALTHCHTQTVGSCPLSLETKKDQMPYVGWAPLVIPRTISCWSGLGAGDLPSQAVQDSG